MEPKVTDRAGIYLQKMYSGYTCRSSIYNDPGTVKKQVLNTNPQRVMVIFSSDNAGVFIWFRDPDGRENSFGLTSAGSPVIASVKDHMMIPSFEWIAEGTLGDDLVIFEILKQ